MTDDDLDQLLALTARRFGGGHTPPDAGAALRRLARDLADFRSGTYEPAPWWDAVSRARGKLDSLTQWVLAQPGAVDAVRRWAETSPTFEFADSEHLDLDNLSRIEASLAAAAPEAVTEDTPAAGAAEYPPFAVEGARVFACLLHQAGHPVSAAFWWQFAAGAQDRQSAYCLYLLHLSRGDLHQAQIWYEQAIPRPSEATESPAHLENFPQILDRCAGSTGLHGSRTRRPGPGLRAAVQRLIDVSARAGDEQGIAARPDRELADTLAEFAGNP